MKKWYGGVLSTSFFMFCLVVYYMIRNPTNQTYFPGPLNDATGTNPLLWINSGSITPALPNPESKSQVVSIDATVSDLFARRNFSREEESTLHTWTHLKYLVTHAQGLPNAVEAVKEAGVAWKNLIASVEDEKRINNGNLSKRGKDKQCPHFLSKMNASELEGGVFKLRAPCGLTQGSSITFIGIPNGLLGDFRVELTGEPLPGEPDPPIILHYNVRLHGDKVTEEPVIVQNTWTIAHDWGAEERCPSPKQKNNKKVDELDQCNQFLGKEINQTAKVDRHGNGKPRKYFPFKQNDLFVATFRVGSEGIQMTVDGKHITSFAFRDEWPHDRYPPFAHGPGYVVSSDIARIVANKHSKGQLKIFKLEDVAMGVWIDDMKKNGLEVKYENEGRIANFVCVDGYVVAHYQGPRDMLCLWQNILEKKGGLCCRN